MFVSKERKESAEQKFADAVNARLFPKTPEDHFKYCDASRILLEEYAEVLSASLSSDTLCHITCSGRPWLKPKPYSVPHNF